MGLIATGMILIIVFMKDTVKPVNPVSLVGPPRHLEHYDDLKVTPIAVELSA